jgi:chromosome segregation ATPase
MLEQDKQSLMKRLNLVLSELEQATHEKSDITGKLRYQEGLAEDLKRKLDEVSSIKNVVNRNLQEDLRYERELNEKLRVELDRFQREKEGMLSKLREQEGTREDISRETNQLNANLLRKNDELRKLEAEHESNCHRLRDLND